EIGEADPLETAVDARPPRRADRLTHLLFASVGGALDHAGLDPRAHAPDRIGLFVGTGQLPDGPAASFWRCALERGFDRASGPAFARMVLNAPAGAVGRSLELRGPLTVVADGEGAGLSAAVLAFDWLRRRDDADVLIVASAFEVGRIVRDGPTSSGTHEASAAVVFARSSWAEAAGVAPRLRVVDASLTGAGPRTSRDRPRHDAADLVALVDACHRADRDRVVAHSSSFGDVGTRATLSLAPHAPLPLTTSRPHAKATLHG
ncbi:MAG: beta-ketoacyl synthase N-terminal-like domain-containing protein, partial [Polyangiaceae bacterium]